MATVDVLVVIVVLNNWATLHQFQAKEKCRLLDVQLQDKEGSIHQLKEEKENLTNKIQQLEQENNEVSKNLENKKLELLQMKEETEKWVEKNGQLETQITKVFGKLLWFYIMLCYYMFTLY